MRESRLNPVCAGKWLAIFALGCAGADRGARVEVPASSGHATVSASARTSERDGLRVLWNGPVRGRDFAQRGFVAGSRADVAALWQEVSPPAAQPALDLSRFFVFGFSGQGSECPREVVAIDAEPNDVLRVRTANEALSCSDVAVRRGLVVAVPRRLLRRTVTVVTDYDVAFAFRVPSPGKGPERVEPASSSTAPAVLGSEPGGQVELPERGKISLRKLSDGTEVWVAHHADGTVDALAASVSLREYPGVSLDAFFASVLSYRQETGRFGGGYDAHGRSVHGWAPLQAFAVVRTDASHVAVGGRIPTMHAPIQARAEAPGLEGPDRAYSTLSLTRAWASIADGRVALLDSDVVVPGIGPAEVCHAPSPDAPLESFSSCPADSPRVEGSAGSDRAHIVYGPFVVRRRGATASVTLLEPPSIRALRP